MKTFTEFTYTDGEIEIMVHHDARARVVALYTYARDAKEINESDCDGRNGKPLRPFAWQEGKNPLFLHLHGSEMRRFVREFIDSGELVCTERENAE